MIAGRYYLRAKLGESWDSDLGLLMLTAMIGGKIGYYYGV